MFNVPEGKLTQSEAVRLIEEQGMVLDERLKSGRMPRKVAEDVKGRQRNMSEEPIEDLSLIHI